MIITPWTIDKFAGSSRHLQVITDNLYRLGFPMEDLKTLKDEKVRKTTRKVIGEINGMQMEEKMPWLVLLCNDDGLLQALANSVPCSWALTTSNSVYTVDTPYLLDAFRMRRPFDVFDADPGGDIIDEVKTAGLLFWRDIGVRVVGSDKYTGRYNQIISHRIYWKLPTIFGYCYSGQFDSKMMEGIFRGIKEWLGDSIASSIENYASIRNYKVEHNQTGSYKEEII